MFHFYTGPSKTEDLAHLTPQNLAWVQVCDLSGTPRELAGDSDRILPGEGDFQLGPIIEHLGADRIRWPRLARSPQPSSLAGRSGSAGRPGPPGPPPGAGPVGIRALRNRKEGPRRVVARDPPTRGGHLPRGTVLRLANLQLSSPWARCFTGLALSRGRVWSLEFGLGLALGLGLLMVVIIFLLHMTTEVTPTDLRVWFGWIPTYRRIRADRHRFALSKSSPIGRSPITASGEFDPAATANER